MTKGSDKFGVWRQADGGLLVEFFGPDGKTLTSRVTFDREAAEEFAEAIRRAAEVTSC